MNSHIASWFLSPLKKDLCPNTRDEVTDSAETELSAFYHAVRIHHGTASAEAAAEHWLRVFASAPIDRKNLKASFRKISAAAVSMHATELAAKPQDSGHPFACTPCHATSISGCR